MVLEIIDSIALIIIITSPLAMAYIVERKSLFDSNHRHTNAGKWFITLAIVAAVAGLYSGISNNKNSNRLILNQNQLQDSVNRISQKYNRMEKSLNDNGIKTDEITGRIINIDSQLTKKKDNIIVIGTKNNQKSVGAKPRLFIHPDTLSNPIIRNTEKGKIFSIAISSINGTSFIKKYRFIVIDASSKEGDAEIIDGRYTQIVSTLIVGAVSESMVFFDRLKYKSDDYYIVYDAKYANDQNEMQPLFRKIYYVSELGRGGQITEVNDLQYNELSSILHKLAKY